MNAVHPAATTDPAPRRLWPVTGPPIATALHDSAANRRLEVLAAARLPAHALMQRAGASLARLALALAPHAAQVQVLAGPGNNGGDGFEAAAWLRRRGLAVQVWFLGDPARLPPDAAAARQRARDAGVPVAPWSAEAERATAGADPDQLIVDALLGRGLARPARGDIAAAIEAMGRSRAPVLAVDLPSGLPADTGSPPDAAPCTRAQATLALLSPAPGLFTGQGRDFAGEIWWDDLGVDLDGVAASAWLNDGALGAGAARRRHAQHKGSFGDVRVVGGAASMTGAALLAGRAALHAGAGRVYLHLLDRAAAHLDGTTPELMFGAALDAAALQQRCTVLAGCGGGPDVAAVLPGLFEQAQRLVLDADALNALAADAVLQTALRCRATRGLPTLLTPHPLEAARLLDPSRPDVAALQADRLGAATRLAQQLQAVVLLKGSGTVIAAPGGPCWINPSGNAALAVPGSGDVLAGWLAGLWSAQAGLAEAPPCALDGALQAARQAVFRHGRLAERLSPAGHPLPARRLADAIAGPDAMRGLD